MIYFKKLVFNLVSSKMMYINHFQMLTISLHNFSIQFDISFGGPEQDCILQNKETKPKQWKNISATFLNLESSTA
jgi:hypothetical protein